MLLTLNFFYFLPNQVIISHNFFSVNAVMKLRNELMEENPNHEIFRKWHGDPCTPYFWNGLACEEMNGSFVITKL